VVAAEMNHLRSEAELDQAIVHEEDRLVSGGGGGWGRGDRVKES